MKSRGRLIYLFFPIFVVYLLVLIVPLVRALTYSSLSEIITDLRSGIIPSIEYTYIVCAFVAVLAVLAALPYAYVMSRHRSTFFKAVDSVVEIPIMIPHTVVGIIMLLTFEPSMPLGHILSKYIPGYSFDDTLFAVIITLFFLSSAYSIREVGVSYQRTVVDYEDVAKTLGLTEGMSFLVVSMRLLARSMMKGFLLSWARSVSEVGAILIVAYYIFPSFIKLAGVFIYSQWLGFGLYPAAASSAILIVTGIIVTGVFRVVETVGVRS
ncbi:ABC transporter permease related protein [Thermoplasma acidophilum]|uniref:ABC transporter permease related protein n=1 Tax=Thermoplasma acidophilum (strain ATCC 25905 / DSM 1728 / JCM 9062 / NBRC 15155 / AMRC-C165) TaxID=273075 RepID=Q9HJB9_THEAC|nr:ABC transporter permease [Thermoplasma acidophilum]MCY0851784.1 ABC transporter permease [Thermoplasma acidophilum]CAC12179.1 ABC transporter permease related protein [Thermoplasma acidophilum]